MSVWDILKDSIKVVNDAHHPDPVKGKAPKQKPMSDANISRQRQNQVINRSQRQSRGETTKAKLVEKTADGRGTSGTRRYTESVKGRVTPVDKPKKSSPKKKDNGWSRDKWDHPSQLKDMAGETWKATKQFPSNLARFNEDVAAPMGKASVTEPPKWLADSIHWNPKTEDPLVTMGSEGFDGHMGGLEDPMKFIGAMASIIPATGSAGKWAKGALAEKEMKVGAQRALARRAPGAVDSAKAGQHSVGEPYSPSRPNAWYQNDPSFDGVDGSVQSLPNALFGRPAGPHLSQAPFPKPEMIDRTIESMPNEFGKFAPNPVAPNFGPKYGPWGPGPHPAFKGSKIKPRMDEEYRRFMENEWVAQQGAYENGFGELPYPKGTFFD